MTREKWNDIHVRILAILLVVDIAWYFIAGVERHLSLTLMYGLWIGTRRALEFLKRG